jgi:NADH dehydrogenase/NADH:ubiquinone oxidoreductase subunit G
MDSGRKNTKEIIEIRVDDQTLRVAKGTNLLEACLANDIYIPNLCHLEGENPAHASCRLCFVEIEGGDAPVPSCTIAVTEPLHIHTGTPAVRRLQKAGLQLLLSVHHVDCKNCPANKKCALQNMARFLKVALKSKGLDRYLKEIEVDTSHPFFDYYPNRCVLCGKCVRVCRNAHDQSLLTFAERGFNTVIAYFGGKKGTAWPCADCNACIAVCPVSAIVKR